MNKSSEINLIEVISPLSLLKCKSILKNMVPGEYLIAWFKDPETVDDLTRIIKQSNDFVIDKQIKDGNYKITIQKGGGMNDLP